MCNAVRFPTLCWGFDDKILDARRRSQKLRKMFFSCKQMQLCIVSFCLAFRFNRFVQIPSHPLIEFVRHGKLDTVCLSRCRNVFSPLEWVVSCAGGQLKFWPSLLNLSQAMVMHPSYGSWRNQDTICPEQLMSLSSLSTRTCL